MTRFARAKGSKSSNVRTPEDSTPWEVMKEQILISKKDNEDSKKREEAEKQRIENYNNFLKERKTEKRKATWCDFPESVSVKKPKNNVEPDVPSETQVIKKNKKNKKRHNLEGQVTNNDSNSSLSNINTMKQNTQKDDNEFIGLKTNEITTANNIDPLENKKAKNKKNKNKTNTINKSQENLPAEKEKKDKNLLQTQKDDNEFIGLKTNEITNANNIDPLKNKKAKNKKNKNKTNTINKSQENLPVEKKNDNNLQEKTDTDNISMHKNNGESNKIGSESLPRKNQPKKLHAKPNRRKVINDKSFELIINGKKVELMRCDGFPVMKKDAEKLEELRMNMIKKGIPKSEVQRTIKLERRRAEKALARLKRDVCYNCRKGGHNLSDCPDLKSNIPGKDVAEGICFKCGSTEHRQFECKVQKANEFRFANCFICKESGHIARQCPDNPKGLYPNGGSCKLCGDVTHLRKDCPTVLDKKEDTSIKLQTLNDDIESIGQQNKPAQEMQRKPKKIKF